MANAWRNDVLRDLRTLFESGACFGQPDGELLDRFAGRRGEGAEHAFAALVTRHGPMVLSVCRRVLADAHDVEDAFQATFLVLAQKAGSIRSRDSLASWLYGVAFRVASCARAASARRRRHERRRAELAARHDHQAHGPRDDLGLLLREELARLPETLRAPVVLCDLEGRSYDEAARQLVCPVGTVKSRLARARERLRVRLARRGLAPTSLTLAAALGDDALATVSPLLHSQTVRAAVGFAAGSQVATVAVTATVAALTRGVLHAMFLSKLKAAGVALVAVAVLATGAIGQDPPRRDRDREPARHDEERTKDRPRDDGEADRLRQVERKLDSVLEMLERQALRGRGPGGLPEPGSLRERALERARTRLAERPRPPFPAGPPRGGPERDLVEPLIDRIIHLERTVESLERRIVVLEEMSDRSGRDVRDRARGDALPAPEELLRFTRPRDARKPEAKSRSRRQPPRERDAPPEERSEKPAEEP